MDYNIEEIKKKIEELYPNFKVSSARNTITAKLQLPKVRQYVAIHLHPTTEEPRSFGMHDYEGNAIKNSPWIARNKSYSQFLGAGSRALGKDPLETFQDAIESVKFRLSEIKELLAISRALGMSLEESSSIKKGTNMKLTESQLRRIIREELEDVNKQAFKAPLSTKSMNSLKSKASNPASSAPRSSQVSSRSIKDRLPEILRLHALFLDDDPGGSRADLSRAELRGADLEDADLQSAILRSAVLQGADLEGANLKDANLQGADLRGAALQGSDLRYAILQGAELQYADLRHTDLRSADLRSAILRGVDLRHANLQRTVLRGADLEGANLQGVNFRYADLEGANLQRANLRGADLKGAKYDPQIKKMSISDETTIF
jgi:hypothetical protein